MRGGSNCWAIYRKVGRFRKEPENLSERAWTLPLMASEKSEILRWRHVWSVILYEISFRDNIILISKLILLEGIIYLIFSPWALALFPEQRRTPSHPEASPGCDGIFRAKPETRARDVIPIVVRRVVMFKEVSRDQRSLDRFIWIELRDRASEHEFTFASYFKSRIHHDRSAEHSIRWLLCMCIQPKGWQDHLEK